MRRAGVVRAARARAAASVVVGAYGAAATAALVVVWLVGDRSSATFTLALTYFWWLVPGPAALVAALVLRSWPLLLLTAAPALVLATLQGPTLVPGRGGGAADLRVATYNISHGAPVADVVALAHRWRPGVLLLQEVTPHAQAQLAVLDAQYPYRSAAPLQAGHHGDANAVLSRYPITSTTLVRGLPRDSRPTDVVRLDVRGHQVAVVSLHLASPCVGCTSYGDRANPSGDTAHAARVRRAEAVRFAALARTEAATGVPLVMGGDVNSSDLDVPLRLLDDAGLTDVHRAVGYGPELTRGPGVGTARIDVLLVHGLRPVDEHEGPRGVSTHAPVVADLAW